MKIQLPFFRQSMEYTCGPAVLKMVLSFFGNFKEELELARKAETSSKTGTKHRGMIRVAQREGFFCYVNSNSSLDEIKHFIGMGKPVIVDYTEYSKNEGHYSVVVGFTKHTLLFNDPWHGKDYKLPIKKFTDRWYDRLTRSHHWIMVIDKEHFEIGKQYLPKKTISK